MTIVYIHATDHTITSETRTTRQGWPLSTLLSAPRQETGYKWAAYSHAEIVDEGTGASRRSWKRYSDTASLAAYNQHAALEVLAQNLAHNVASLTERDGELTLRFATPPANDSPELNSTNRTLSAAEQRRFAVAFHAAVKQQGLAPVNLNPPREGAGRYRALHLLHKATQGPRAPVVVKKLGHKLTVFVS